jgi:hypothetical protein
MPSSQADGALAYVLFGLRILLALALYAFLAALLWALLRERSSEKGAHSPPAWLTEDRSDRQARNHRYAIQSETWIGRDPNCAICVDDESVSDHHACILWESEAQTWYIEDNLSESGTFVNGRRTACAALKDGDVIQVGRSRFVFICHTNKQVDNAPRLTQALPVAHRP